MFERILVPLDGSRLGTKALPYAIEIAKKFDAEVIMLQVVKPTTPVAAAGPVGMESPVATEMVMQTAQLQDKKNTTSARGYLRRQLKRVTDKSIKGSYHVVIGTPAESITRFCHEKHTDLVVMTTHGRSGFKRAILGSVADGVVREPGIPVLVIRP